MSCVVDEDDYESSFNPFEVETGENPSSSTDSGMILERSWSELTALESSEEDEEDEKDDEDFAELRRWRSPEVSATPAPSPALPSKLPLVVRSRYLSCNLSICEVFETVWSTPVNYFQFLYPLFSFVAFFGVPCVLHG